MKPIRLRVLGFVRKGGYYAICLETNSIVRGDSFDDVKRKMEKALLVYLQGFNSEQMKNQQFRRPTPARFIWMWRLLKLMGLIDRVVSVFNADYDPTSAKLQVA